MANADSIFKMLDAYTEYGGNVLDTAGIYNLHKSEQVLALWLKARRNRSDLVILSKCCHHYVDEQGQHYPDQKRVKPEIIIQDLQDSLTSMQVDYFDIFLLHRDDPAVSVNELMDVLEEQKSAGLIKSYGVSNWSIERIEAANRYCAAKGYAGIAANSPGFSLAKVNESRWVGCKYADDRYLRWHQKTQLPLFAWAAQASGFFNGMYTPDNIPNQEIARVYYNEENWERIRRAGQLAARKGRQYTANHIALAYVLNQPFPVCAIIGPQNAEQLLASLRALDIRLDRPELLWLNMKLERSE